MQCIMYKYLNPKDKISQVSKSLEQDELLKENIYEATGCHLNVLEFISSRCFAGAITWKELAMAYAMIRNPSIEAAARALSVSRDKIIMRADAVVNKIRNDTSMISFERANPEKGNRIVTVDGRKTIASVATVSIRVPSDRYVQKPNYLDGAVKFLVSVSHSGFILSVDGPYTGSSPDDVIADDCRIFPKLAEAFPGMNVIAEENFSENKAPNLIIPSRRRKVAVCENAKTLERTISDVCSRIEHVFGGGDGLQRFPSLMSSRWKRDINLLRGYFFAACLYRNAEVFVKHGHAGIYSSMDVASLQCEGSAEDTPETKEEELLCENAANSILLPPMPLESSPALSAPLLEDPQYSVLAKCLYDWGVTSEAHFKWMLSHFNDEELINEIPNAKNVCLRWLLMNARQEWNIKTTQKGDLRKWLDGQIDL